MDEWGPRWWYVLKMAIDTSPPDGSKLVAFIDAFSQVLPCQKCIVNFQKVLKQYPVEPLRTATVAQRQQWYQQVREEVRKHEQPMTAARWLSKYRTRISVTIGFVLLAAVAFTLGFLLAYAAVKRRPST